MHQALYRKWRPSDFSSVCGQEHITSILKYEVESGKTSHAYLFCGSRGTGKTTCAKILAKAINCEHPVNGNPCNKCDACRSIDEGTALDVYEMDAASNNGVDNVRDIIDEIVYTPSNLKNRIYIIDEVHMLSVSAFNALLKTLEEPPENVVFILATTEIQKIPATVLSRCQRFDFRRIPSKIISDRLKFIAANENIAIDDEASFLIAKLSNGGMRDAISMLELCSGENNSITKRTVEATTGINSHENISETVKGIINSDYEKVISVINDLHKSSLDITVFWNDLLEFYRDLFVVKNTKNSMDYLEISDSEYEEIKNLSSEFTNSKLLSHISELEASLNAMQRPNSSKRICAEISLIKLCDNKLSTSYEALNERLTEIEDKVNGLSPVTPVISNIPCDKPITVSDENTKSDTAKANEKTSVISSKGESTGRVLKQMANWPEAVKKFSKLDMSKATFLGMAMGYKTDDNKIIIKVKGQFTLDILSQTLAKEQLASVISATENYKYSSTDIILELATPKEDKDESNGIDLIISESENN